MTISVLTAARRNQGSHRDVPLHDGTTRACGIDDRSAPLGQACGYFRFAHIDGRIPSNPAQHVRRPKVQPTERHRMNRGELGRFLFTAWHFDHDHATLAVLLGLNGLRVSEACATNVIEDLGLQHGLTARSASPVRATSQRGFRSCPARHERSISPSGERCQGPILRRQDNQRLDRRTAHRWVRSIGIRAGLGIVHPHMLRAAFIMAALDAGVPLHDVQLAARHADRRTTTIYDRRRQNFDRHAAYVVVAFVASG